MRTLRIAVVSLFLLAPSAALAQEKPPSVVWGVAKSVLFDPTTYMPAAMSYTSQRMDWNTSQPLFEHGWLEHNPRFTTTGHPDDTPFGFQAGNRQIERMALMHLQESLLNNTAAQIFDRVLAARYPQHKKLFKTLSWVERIAFSSYVSYLASANHFKQARMNVDTARTYGYIP